MEIIIKENGYSKHAELLRERISERISVISGSVITINLNVKENEKKESYSISSTDGEWHITGTDELGLYYGIGKFLHAASWKEDTFTPKTTDLVSPKGDFRNLYISRHFCNFYENAPVDVVTRYVDDMLLWGYNVVSVLFPFKKKEDTESQYKENMQKTIEICKHVKSRGMKICSGAVGGINTAPEDAPHDFDAAPNVNLWVPDLGRRICLSKPGAMDYKRQAWIQGLQNLVNEGIEVNFFTTWPYDEGGCGCEKCYPWGANGYLKGCIAFREEALKYFPNAKFIISTWLFDCLRDIGEYEGLYKRLKTDLSWVDYIMVDDHGDFPKYPLSHDVVKPIVNFPEISMYGLFPWGGFGACPLPKRFQRIWDSIKHIVSGGEPYSEGIYEDISKVQCVGYYWNPDKDWKEILTEYVNYEFFVEDEKDVEDILDIMCCIEENHVRIAEHHEPDMEVAKHGKEIADAIDHKLSQKAKTSWRWRILYIRAQLDFMRYTAYMENTGRTEEDLKKMYGSSADLLIDNEVAQGYFKELRGYYYSVPCNGYNMFTLPPIGKTVPASECILY